MDDLGVLYCGQSPSVSEVNHERVGTPYVTGPDQLFGRELKIDKWTKFPRRLVPKGCIFITVKGAGVGKTFSGIACAIGRDVYAFKPHALINQTFLHHALDFEIHKVIGQSAGLIPGLSRDHIMDHKVPLPPLQEQHRIVAKLDSILPRVEKVRERLEKILALVKRFRQSVLTAAVTGKLTEQWREKNFDKNEDLESFGELPGKIRNSYLNVFEVTKQSDLPEKWVNAPLINLGVIQGGGTPSKSNKKYWNGKTPWISPKDMKVDRISHGLDFISREAIEESSVKLIPKKSILFVVRGMILAHTFPVAITLNDVTINQDMKGLTPHSGIDPEYLFLAMGSIQNRVLNFIDEATHGTLKLDMKVIESFAIPLPPFSEQQEIVRQVEKLFDLANKLQAHYHRAMARVEKFPQAILAKAFRGELVPQDPNDEPAEKLLERIRKEREKLEGAPKSSGSRKPRRIYAKTSA